MKRNPIYTLIAYLLLAAYSSEEKWNLSDHIPAAELGERQITVRLNLQTTDFTVEETRSATPIDLRIENPMYNLWLLHYNEEGGLVENGTKYIHLNDRGELATNYTAALVLTDGSQGTLYLIANLGGTGNSSSPSAAYTPSNDNGSWPKTLQLLRKELLTLPIDRNTTNTTLGLLSKIFMYGFYQGTLNVSHPVSTTLGRMAAHLGIVIKTTDSEITLRNFQLQLKNAVIKSHYSPMKTDSKEDTCVDFPLDSIFKSGTVTNSTPITYYYFTGENTTPKIGKGTVLIVRADRATAETGEIDVIVKCNKGDADTQQCEYRESPDYNNQEGGFIDYDTKTYYRTTRNSNWFLGYTCSYVYYKKEKRAVKVEGSEKTIPYTYTVKLGVNASGISDDRSLYRNNNYTFNVNLK